MWLQLRSSSVAAATRAPADALSTALVRRGHADHGASSKESLRTIVSEEKLKISRASTRLASARRILRFLFFFGLAYFGLIGADEPGYAQVAREMLARHDCISPTLEASRGSRNRLFITGSDAGLHHLRRERLGCPFAICSRCHVDGVCVYLFLNALGPDSSLMPH